MSVGALRYGDIAAREVSQRIGGLFATTTALAALPADRRVDGMLCCVQNVGWYTFEASATVGGLAPAAGTGRWVSQGNAGLPNIIGARVATATTLPAYTRTANVLLANANGALNDTGIDGVTDLAVGEYFLLKNGAAGADNGVYVLTSIGGASAKWGATRVPEMDASADLVPNTLVLVAEGTANVDIGFVLTTNAGATLNTTTLTFTAAPSVTALAAAGGAALVGLTDTYSKISGSTLQALVNELTTTTGAAMVGIADTYSKYTGTDVGAALDELATDTGAAIVGTSRSSTTEAELTSLIAEEVIVPLGSLTWNTGAPIAAFADNSVDGYQLTSSECLGVRWNNDTAPRITVAGEFHVPTNWDDTAIITLHCEGFREGSADAAMVLTVTAFAVEVGDAHDADADAGGSTTAFDGATHVITDETLAFTAGVLPAGSKVSFTLVADAALDDDDFILTGIKFVGSRALA